ncbi:MAG: ferritin family protein [Magnetococcales bacterium]|nr:ferritin family protein [Magnetococcales bacterium]
MKQQQRDKEKLLKAKKSIVEILEVAMEFERTAQVFYAELASRVSKRIRYLVEELAEEEQGHYDRFKKLRDREDLEEQINTLITLPASDGHFSDAVHLPQLGEKPDDQEVLQYALWREHLAIDQYHALAESTAPGPIQDLFLFLVDEETKHKKELEKIYYEVVHSGGV